MTKPSFVSFMITGFSFLSFVSLIYIQHSNSKEGGNNVFVPPPGDFFNQPAQSPSDHFYKQQKISPDHPKCEPLTGETLFATKLEEIKDKIFELTVLGRIFDDPPSIEFSDFATARRLCRKFNWYFCREQASPRSREEEGMEIVVPGYGPHYWNSSGAQLVLRIPCAQILARPFFKKEWQGLIRDATHHYVTSLQQMYTPAFTEMPVTVVHFARAGYHVTKYPTAFAHIWEGLPRLLHLLDHIPEDIPVLVAKSPTMEALLDLLEEANNLRDPQARRRGRQRSRFRWWSPAVTYEVDELWVPGEACRLYGAAGGEGGAAGVAAAPGASGGGWFLHQESECGSRVFLPYARLRSEFLPLLEGGGGGGAAAAGHPNATAAGAAAAAEVGRPLVLVVDRSDAGSRRVLNHAALVAAVAAAVNGGGGGGGGAAEVRSVALAALPLREQVALFLRARLVVAPHGAALALAPLLAPGGRAAALEVGYAGQAFPWPAQFFGAQLARCGVAHFATLARGGYAGDLRADAADAGRAARRAWARTGGGRGAG